MSIVTRIEEVVAVVNELAALKAALGIPDHATISDVVAEIKHLGSVLTGILPAKDAPAIAEATSVVGAAAGVVEEVANVAEELKPVEGEVGQVLANFETKPADEPQQQ